MLSGFLAGAISLRIVWRCSLPSTSQLLSGGSVVVTGGKLPAVVGAASDVWGSSPGPQLAAIRTAATMAMDVLIGLRFPGIGGASSAYFFFPRNLRCLSGSLKNRRRVRLGSFRASFPEVSGKRKPVLRFFQFQKLRSGVLAFVAFFPFRFFSVQPRVEMAIVSAFP